MDGGAVVENGNLRARRRRPTLVGLSIGLWGGGDGGFASMAAQNSIDSKLVSVNGKSHPPSTSPADTTVDHHRNKEIATLNDSLQSSDQIVSKMTSVLDSFDDRLTSLETSILPIHHATQRLTRLYDNVSSCVLQLNTVIGYFDMASGEEAFVSLGPKVPGLDAYMATIDRLKLAFDFLSHAKVKNSEKYIQSLRLLIDRGTVKLEESFKQILTEESTRLDDLSVLFDSSAESDGEGGATSPSPGSSFFLISYEFADAREPRTLQKSHTEPTGHASPTPSKHTNLPHLPPTSASNSTSKLLSMDALTRLQKISHRLSSSNAAEPSQSLTKLYVTSRSAFLLGTLQTFSNSTGGVYVMGERRHNSHSSLFTSTPAPSSASPFVLFTKSLLALFDLEWNLLHLIFSPSLDAPSASSPSRRHFQHHRFFASTFHAIVSAILNIYKECADSITVRAKRLSVQHHDFSSYFLLLDVVENVVGGLVASQSTQPNSSHLLVLGDGRASWHVAMKSLDLPFDNDPDHVMHEFSWTALNLLSDFLDEVRNSGTKSSNLPDDATVHELSSNTMNHMKRICEYLEFTEILFVSFSNFHWTSSNSSTPVSSTPAAKDLDFLHRIVQSTIQFKKKNQSILTPASTTPPQRDSDSLSVQQAFPNTRKYLLDLFTELLSNLETKSKGYKKGGGGSAIGSGRAEGATASGDKNTPKPVISTIFLINNFHFILKNIRTQPLLLHLLDVEAKLEKRVGEELAAYQECWNHIIEHLMDTTFIRNGEIKQQLSSSERQNIKDRFKNFNSDFEDLHKLQRKFSVPDIELRTSIIRTVKKMVLPMYSRFLDRYQTISFSNTPSKYIKYDSFLLELMLDQFFHSSSSE